ncbi:hypothetical protein [Rufibacter latericius]|uniref:Uncharacterized protein n=1 Tax=Rufibacter latericius TaxID=2487040 RepID=A0A3M9N194_9BACT|nr:hypothetical protein [Rufibacter latericius]RNI31540.1 hypothetical protein EFB08_03200 [Rufibacter latericius]
MKTKILLLTLFTVAFSFFTGQAWAQTTENQQELKTEQDSIKQRAQDDKKRLNALTDLKKDTKADAKVAKERSKEASRIEKEASDAAQEAKQAARLERKAQRNRMNADKQARKAEKAMEKTIDN